MSDTNKVILSHGKECGSNQQPARHLKEQFAQDIDISVMILKKIIKPAFAVSALLCIS